MSSNRTILRILPVLAGLGCGGLPTSASAMVGASPGARADSLVMVLRREGGTAGFCTGIVLARDVVLTAAHCAPKGDDVRVLLPGDPSKPETVPVTGLAPNPEYRPNAVAARQKSIDLALLRLARPLPDAFSPAVLAQSAGAKLGARFVASGYGVGQEGQPATSGTLRSATLVTRAPLSQVLLWAEDPAKSGAGACTGDSGGPVSAEGSADIAAVMLWSAGTGAQHCGDLTQAIWLAPQKAWIDRVMQAWSK